MPPNPPNGSDAAGLGCGGAAGFEAYRDRIDCFKSDLPGTPGVLGPVLEGLAGGADCVPPKKSKPSKLSPGFVCFVCAAGALGGPGLLIEGSVVLGLAGCGAGSSPKRSTCGALAGGGTIEGALPFLRLAPLARSFAFSCTTFNGTSSSISPSSNVLGSGIGPSMTHRLLSYFVLMKFSILASLGTWPSANLCSQYLFALALPHLIMLCICSSVQESRSTDFTLETCVPMPRWIPEQRMQMNTPIFQLAHRGCLLRLQSAQLLFDSTLTSAFRVARLASARSAPAGGRRDMIAIVCASCN